MGLWLWFEDGFGNTCYEREKIVKCDKNMPLGIGIELKLNIEAKDTTIQNVAPLRVDRYIPYSHLMMC